MERLGQVVIGFPGAGKTTYCKAMSEFLTAAGRPNLVVNLDAANDTYTYEVSSTQCPVDIRDLITLEDAMEACDLGPNGALMYCMQVVYTNAQWLVSRLGEREEPMVILDCPGQVELYVHDSPLKSLLHLLQKQLNLRLVVVNLLDSHICVSSASYLSSVLASTAMMTSLELPHLNIFTKVDLIGNYYQSLQFDLRFYGNCEELERLAEGMSGKRAKLARKLAGVIEDFSLVAYLPFSVKDPETQLSVMKQVDRALGCGFLYSSSLAEELESERWGRIEEKYSKAPSTL